MNRQEGAKAILSIPTFHDLLGELEVAAMNRIIQAAYEDHETRQAFAAEVRAIRNFRAKVEQVAKDGAPALGKSAPA